MQHRSDRRAIRPILLAVLAALPFAAAAPAQEHKELGRMWTFENAPLDWFETAYDFRPTQEWLDHVRLSSLRYGQGCSASFVSPRGLILTNHHCARSNVAEVTPDGQDWLGDGFFATSLGQEVRVPGLTVQQLVAMRDITDTMNAGLADAEDDGDRRKRVNQNRRDIMKAAKEARPDLTHQVVALYQGGNYQLYSYKIFDDIRLVASPHLQAAKFGGDPDNFTYPRFSLDYALLRAWDGDKPADTKAHYMRFKAAGPQEGDTVFVTGNPGSTGRLNTIAQMEFMRDVQYPRQVSQYQGALEQAQKIAASDPERGKAMRSQILSIENALKAFTGYLNGLQNDAVMDVKRAAEDRIRKAVAADPELEKKFGTAWTDLEEIANRKRKAFEDRDQGALTAATRDETAAAKRIGEAFFAVYGTAIPPDATFTLRISDGVVAGFPMNGTIAPWFTSLYGLYARNIEFGNEDPFHLPQAWLDKKDTLDLSTPFNLVSTCDIIGGNSGSPMINTDGEVVGLVFDGNIESLGNRFVFTDDVPRTVCVHPAIIVESMRKIYDAGTLADELEGKGDGYQ